MVALLILASGAATSALMPSRAQLESALTFNRFNDECADASTGDGCPPINIYKVFVRKQRCLPAAIPASVPGFRGATISAATCRFESGVGTISKTSRPHKWTSDSATLFALEAGVRCEKGDKSEICDPLWVIPHNY